METVIQNIYLTDQLWNQSKAYKARFDYIANSSPSSMDMK